MLALGWTIGFGLAAARSASRLDRSAVVWFVFGAILGPIALLILWQSPPAWCRVCLMPARGMLQTCWWCGTTFRGVPTSGLVLATSSPDARQMPERPPHAHPTRAVDLGTRVAALGPAVSSPPDQAPGPPPALAPSPSTPTTAPSSPPARAAPTPAAAPQSPLPETAPSPSDGVPVMDAPPRERNRRRSTARATTPGPDVPASRAGPVLPPPEVQTAVAERTHRPAILATAVFYSGTVRLELGSRYGFVIDDGLLRIVGPLSPSVIAYERRLAGVTTSVAHGRVLLTVPVHRASEILAFTSVVGLSLDGMADAIQQAADAAARA